MLDRRQKLSTVNKADNISKWAMGVAVASFLCLWYFCVVSLGLALWARKFGENPRTTLALWMSGVSIALGVLHFVAPTVAAVLSLGACAWGLWLLYRSVWES